MKKLLLALLFFPEITNTIDKKTKQTQELSEKARWIRAEKDPSVLKEMAYEEALYLQNLGLIDNEDDVITYNHENNTIFAQNEKCGYSWKMTTTVTKELDNNNFTTISFVTLNSNPSSVRKAIIDQAIVRRLKTKIDELHSQNNLYIELKARIDKLKTQAELKARIDKLETQVKFIVSEVKAKLIAREIQAKLNKIHLQNNTSQFE